MGVSWTEEQRQVIELRNRNILVSAAAGSGKTAVLVERIITRITDKVHPVDIDSLLIVTFTNAAAGEMRERIRTAIEKKLVEEPENVHLQRQLTLIHHAQITTIHSFCQHVIRNYFHTIDLDPNFRIGDDGEMKLLRNDTAERLIEELYQEIGAGDSTEHNPEAGRQENTDEKPSTESLEHGPEPEKQEVAKEKEEKGKRYRRFVESFAPGRDDGGLKALILAVYDFSMSYPWPFKWLKDCRRAYDVENVQELASVFWMEPLLKHVRLLLEECVADIRKALAICRQPDGPYMYEKAILDDLVQMEELLNSRDYLEYADAFLRMKAFARLSTKKDDIVSAEKKELVKGIREQVKGSLKAIREQYFYQTPGQMVEDLKGSREQAEVLLELAGTFYRRFSEKKREKNLLDFNDLEHMALDILVKEENGHPVPSDAAEQFADRFEEIMIDEYQDSNLVQEYILTSVSRQSRGVNNVFMVGDVKQSIYRFRLARPELFMGKYASYTTESSPEQKIELHKNFRSRSQVLSSVNFIFRHIMTENLGNICYDDAAALYPGAFYPEAQDPEELDTEVLLLDLEEEAEAVEESGETAVELEARMIGKRILEMVGKAQVVDKATGAYRPAQYRDMVILLRTVSGWADTVASVLGNMGIPAYTGSQSGYFSATEVQTILALLKVVDNPEQEIPLAAVLRSPIVGLSDEELAKIRSRSREGSFPAACRFYAREGEDSVLTEKLKDFYRMLEDFRRRVPYTAMHELLWYILERTGYADYAAAMPGGEQRRANLEMLAEKALAYESTSYRGLFNFNRYMEQLQKYDVDYGEASILGEEENTVRILSIHKSKGLEFPIVFVSGMNKAFNQQDSRSRLALHPEYGIGCDFTDPVLRIKTPTLLKKMIQRKLVEESLGEELRVLYVALTRAKEKLILTGAARLEKKQKKWQQSGSVPGKPLSFGTLTGAGSYLDWVMPVLLLHPAGEAAFGSPGICGQEKTEAAFRIRLFTIGDLAVEEAVHQLEARWTKEALLNWEEALYSRRMREHLDKVFDTEYAWKDSMDIYGKITVSELKSMRQTLDTEEEFTVFAEPDVVPLLPKFLQEKQEPTGAAKGTVYHRLLEHLDYEREASVPAVREQLEEMCRIGKLTKEEAEVIKASEIVHFLCTGLGQRMKQAALAGNLRREQPFVLGVDAEEIRESWTGNDMVLVQGIIDAYFYEEDGIVLVDYKTDYVEPGKEHRLLEKYGIQLRYYARALERLTGCRVKESYIYSFWMGKALRVEESVSFSKA